MNGNTEHKRRNSLERYQPKKAMEEEEINDGMSNISLNGTFKESNDTYGGGRRNNRRGVNSHLYGNNSRGRGRGRGQRGRGLGSLIHPQQNGKENRDNGNKEIEERKWSGNRSENLNFQNSATYTPHQQRERKDQWNGHHNGNAPIKKNTETFKPSHKPADMRILSAHAGWKKYLREITSRDVLVIHDLFCSPDDLTIYQKLLGEMKESGIHKDDLWKLWHGDSHLIADDKQKWKEVCPTFRMILNKIRDYFDMDIKATRLNWYRDSSEWKPFHHDAAAIKPDKAKTQNLTVAVSFGAERDAAFEHATTKTVISMPQPNGTIYVFAKDVNIIWRHGILQVPPEKYHDKGRISIIAWGWSKQIQL